MKEGNPRGLFIVFEGVNGSTKTTTINEIIKFIPRYGKVKVYKFPDRNGTHGKKIDQFLQNQIEIKSVYDRLDLFSANRRAYRDEMIDLLQEGTTIICDRYIYSAIVYQLPVQNTISDICVYATGLIVSDFDKGMIIPDLIFLMDVDCLQLRNEKQQRYHYDAERQNIIRNHFKRILNYSNTLCYTVEPVIGNPTETAHIVMNIIDNMYYTLNRSKLRFISE